MKETLTKKDLEQALKGQWRTEGKLSLFLGIGTDTRKSLENKVFFALKGPHFDGNDFLSEAMDKGAALLIASDKKKIQTFLNNNQINSSIGLLQVEDTLKALQDLSVFWRKKLGLKVICITGSSGKTTTKQFVQSLLPSDTVSSSLRSFNNHWGVPLSLLSVDKPGITFIQEIGASGLNEIAPLTKLCDPVAVAVTTIGPSHLEGFGNMETLVHEKQQIYKQSPSACWVFNEDNPWTRKMLEELKDRQKKILTFSRKNKKADVFLSIVQEKRNEMYIEGHIGEVSGKTKVLLEGDVQLENLMCASALALASFIKPEDIWKRIPECHLPPGRQNWFEWKEQQVSILFDAYNANPLSMGFFLNQCQKFRSSKDRLILILGDMKELGEKSKSYHEELSQNHTLKTSDFIWYIGEYGEIVERALKETDSFEGQFIKSESYEKSLLLKLKDYLQPYDIVGIKASRSLKLEQALFDLTGQRVFSQ